MVQDEINTVGGLWGDCGIGYSMESEMSYRTSGSSRNEMPMGKGGKKKTRLDNKDPFEGLVIHQVVIKDRDSSSTTNQLCDLGQLFIFTKSY